MEGDTSGQFGGLSIGNWGAWNEKEGLKKMEKLQEKIDLLMIHFVLKGQRHTMSGVSYVLNV